MDGIELNRTVARLLPSVRVRRPIAEDDRVSAAKPRGCFALPAALQ